MEERGEERGLERGEERSSPQEVPQPSAGRQRDPESGPLARTLPLFAARSDQASPAC